MRRNPRGFSLVELMICLAIIGILSAIALPSYRQYVLRGNRTEGKALLMIAAAQQERLYALNSRYVTDPQNIADLKLRNTVNGVVSSDSGLYQLTVAAGGDNNGGFLLTATPQNAQQQDLACASLTLDATGATGASGPNGIACWK